MSNHNSDECKGCGLDLRECNCDNRCTTCSCLFENCECNMEENLCEGGCGIDLNVECCTCNQCGECDRHEDECICNQVSAFSLHINIGNDAVETRSDIIALLRKVANQLEVEPYNALEPDSNSIIDDNGNYVGSYSFE